MSGLYISNACQRLLAEELAVCGEFHYSTVERDLDHRLDLLRDRIISIEMEPAKPVVRFFYLATLRSAVKVIESWDAGNCPRYAADRANAAAARQL